MTSIDRAAEAFPEVELDVLKRIYEHYDDPELGRVANVLEQAAAQGKVPQANYRGRVEAPMPRRELHPEFRSWLERKGFDPESAERGLEAEDELTAQRWEDRAQAVTRSGTVSELVDFYLDLADLIREALQSPAMNKLPDDVSTATQIVAGELAQRVEDAGLRGNPDELLDVRDQVLRLPDGDVREAYLESIREWQGLAENTGSEFEDARQYVLDAADGPEAADRLAAVRSGRYDVTPEQLQELAQEAKRRLAA